MFNKNSDSDLLGKNYKLTILKRFVFSSKFQTNSVIVRNELDNTYRYFIKGAPEKVIKRCKLNSLPESYSEKFLEHTRAGFLVLACATKSIPFYNDEIHNDRNLYENDLNFLGLIILKNKLKSDTKEVIRNIKNSNCKLIMATGDNPFTSISVGLESGFFDVTDNIYFCNLEYKISEKSKFIKCYHINSTPVNENNLNDTLPMRIKNNKHYHKGRIIIKLRKEEIKYCERREQIIKRKRN